MANPNGVPAHLRAPLKPGIGRTAPSRVTRARVEEELRHIALSDPLNAFERVKKGSQRFRLRDLNEMPPEVRRCIASIKVRTENLKAGDDAQDTTVEIRFWDKIKALELIGKYLGMFKEHIVVEVLDARKARLREALARTADVIDVAPVEQALALPAKEDEGEP